MRRPSSQSEPGDGRIRAIAEALAVTTISLVAGIVAVMVVSTAVAASGLPSTDALRLLQSRAIQAGFLAVGLGYLAVRGQPSSPVRFRIPSLRGVAWIVAVPPLLVGIGFAVEPLLSMLGIGAPGGTSTPIDGFHTRPLLWLVVLVGWFGIAAPAEELLFRGIVQGRLRERFPPASGILLAAACFGLLHVPIAALSPGMTPASTLIETFVAGTIFGVAYERTGNLVVPSVAHAALWTSGLFV